MITKSMDLTIKRKVMTPKEVQRVMDATPEEVAAGGKDYGVLKRFMKEHFPFGEFCKAGLFKPEWKDDAYKQAVRVCAFFGFKTVFEYGSTSITCHLSYVSGKRQEGEGFITHIENIYE